MALSDTLNAWAPRWLSVTRIIGGLLFTQHGLQKLFLFPGPRLVPGATTPPAPEPILSFMGITGCLELVFGVLLTIGLFTRPVAFLMSGMMAVGYFMVDQKTGRTSLAASANFTVGES